MIFWGWAGRAKSGIPRYSKSSPPWGIDKETLSPCPFPVPRAPASWSPLEVPGQHKHAQTPCNQEMNWSWLVDSQFDSCDEQEVLDVLILQGKANKLRTKTWCTSEVHVFMCFPCNLNSNCPLALELSPLTSAVCPVWRWSLWHRSQDEENSVEKAGKLKPARFTTKGELPW